MPMPAEKEATAAPVQRLPLHRRCERVRSVSEKSQTLFGLLGCFARMSTGPMATPLALEITWRTEHSPQTAAPQAHPSPATRLPPVAPPQLPALSARTKWSDTAAGREPTMLQSLRTAAQSRPAA